MGLSENIGFFVAGIIAIFFGIAGWNESELKYKIVFLSVFLITLITISIIVYFKIFKKDKESEQNENRT